MLGDRNGVLEMCRQRVVGGGDRPLVVVQVDVGTPGGDHRLDRDRHPRLEQRAASRLAEVRDLRVLVVAPADTVAD